MKSKPFLLWQRVAAPLALAVAVAGWTLRPACAAEPAQAQLSVVGTAPDKQTLYIGVRDPFGGAISPSTGCRQLELVVRFRANQGTANVTHDANTTFFSDPPGRVFESCFTPGLEDAGQKFTVYGRYRDPSTGTTVTDHLKFKVELFPAPTFYNAGPAQARLLQGFTDFEAWVVQRLLQSGVPTLEIATLASYLSRVEQGIRQWWPDKIAAPFINFGNSVQALFGTTNPDLAIAIFQRLTGIITLLNQGGITFIQVAGTDEVALIQAPAPCHSFVPPWWPETRCPCFIITCGAFVGFWTGIGR